MSRPGIRRGVAPQFSIPVTAPKVPPAETPLAGPLSADRAVTDTLTEALKPSGSSAATIHYSERFSVPRGNAEVALAPTTVEDIDQLWDWVRSDREGTTAFLGTAHTTTQTFFNQWADLGQKERDGSAWVRSIKRGDALVGFVVLNPIFKTTKLVGTCHIYVNSESRGSLPELLPQIVADGDRQLPGMTFMVATDKEAWATMLKAVGFTAQIVLTRQAGSGDAHGPQAV